MMVEYDNISSQFIQIKSYGIFGDSLLIFKLDNEFCFLNATHNNRAATDSNNDVYQLASHSLHVKRRLCYRQILTVKTGNITSFLKSQYVP